MLHGNIGSTLKATTDLTMMSLLGLRTSYRIRGTPSSTAYSNIGKYRTARHSVSCNAGASRSHPQQYAGRVRSRHSISTQPLSSPRCSWCPWCPHTAHTRPTRRGRKYSLVGPRSPLLSSKCLLTPSEQWQLFAYFPSTANSETGKQLKIQGSFGARK